MDPGPLPHYPSTPGPPTHLYVTYVSLRHKQVSPSRRYFIHLILRTGALFGSSLRRGNVLLIATESSRSVRHRGHRLNKHATVRAPAPDIWLPPLVTHPADQA